MPSRRTWLAAGTALAAGLVLALPDVTTAGLLAAGTALAIAALARPEVCLYLLALAVPFGEIRQVTVGGFTVSGAEVLVALLVLAWLARGISQRNLELYPGPLFWPLAVLLAALLLSLFDTIAYAPSAKELAKWLEVVAVYLVGTSLLHQRGRASWLVLALLTAGALEAAIGIFGSLMRQGPPSYAILGGLLYRASGDFAQPNPFAGYMNHVWPLALALLIVPYLESVRDTQPTSVRHSGQLADGPSPAEPHLIHLDAPVALWNAALLLVTLVTLAALLLSWSRGAWLGAAAALLVMAVCLTAALLRSVSAASQTAGRQLLRVLLVGGVLLASVGLLGAADLLPTAITDRLGSITADLQVIQEIRTIKVNDDNFSTVERVAHWWAGWRMWEDHPWTGVGLGNYAQAYPHYALPRWQDPLGHAHNYYLNIAAEVGLPGLLAYVLWVAAGFWLAVRAVRVSSGLAQGIALGVLGMMVHLSVHNLFDNLYVHGMAIQVGLMLGLAAWVVYSNRGRQAVWRSIKESGRAW